MRWLYLIVTVIILCSVQFIALCHLAAAPDLLIIFAVFLALHAGLRVALLGAWLSGLFSEVCAGNERIGLLAFLLTFLVWVLCRHRDELFTEHWLTRTVIVAVVSIVCGLGNIATVYLETRTLVHWGRWEHMLTVTAWTTLSSIVLLPVFARIRNLYRDTGG